VARIARIVTWNLYMDVSLSIVSRNTQQDVEVHTHKTDFGRRPGAQNVKTSIIKSIYEIHTPEGAAM
jgi:hypothetical protein